MELAEPQVEGSDVWSPTMIDKLERAIDKKLLEVLGFSNYRKTFANYLYVIFHISMRDYPFWGILREANRRVSIPSHLLAYYLSEGFTGLHYSGEGLVSLDFQGKSYSFLGALHNGDLRGVFASEEYSFLKVRNKIVIDVGASIGDSAIYFAAMGAKHVYAFEPYPYSFEIATKNVQLNGLAKEVTLINAGISKIDSTVTIDPRFRNSVTSRVSDFSSGVSVPLLSLRELVSHYEIEDAILKMDCEGGEYASILSSSTEVLRKFKQVQIEFHYGPKKLVDRLRKAGFKVSFTKVKRLSNRHFRKQFISIGYIFADREDVVRHERG